MMFKKGDFVVRKTLYDGAWGLLCHRNGIKPKQPLEVNEVEGSGIRFNCSPLWWDELYFDMAQPNFTKKLKDYL